MHVHGKTGSMNPNLMFYVHVQTLRILGDLDIILYHLQLSAKVN